MLDTSGLNEIVWSSDCPHQVRKTVRLTALSFTEYRNVEYKSNEVAHGAGYVASACEPPSSASRHEPPAMSLHNKDALFDTPAG